MGVRRCSVLICRRCAWFLLAACLWALAAPVSGLAESIRVGIGFAIPPYVIRSEDAGVEVDIIREALGRVGVEAEFIYLPNLRLPVAFAEGSVDCVAANAGYDLAADSGVPAYYSTITVIFHNYAVSLEKNGFSIMSIEDLADKRVLAFNNAAKYLGRDFAAMAASNARYSELADQALQVRMLLSGRVDVVISDKRIFLYWMKKNNRYSGLGIKPGESRLAFHSIFPPAPRRVAFRDEDLRTRFDQGLGLLNSEGGIKVIEERYAGVEEE